jgi:prepilin peptidase CpaA
MVLLRKELRCDAWTQTANGSEMVWLGDLPGIFIIISLLLAAGTDIATRTIPNTIPAVVAVVGLSARLLAGPRALAMSAIAAVLLFAVLLLLHARGLLGGGDVKLIPATAIGFSLPAISHFVFITVMAGGVLAMLYLLGRWVVRGSAPAAPPPRGAALIRRIFSAERWRIARHGSLPYGVAIACGGIWVIISQTGR